ncbi:hypothetical protein EC9_42850 [Rosistilla ulvae]|uniref:Uncharacterized protein n=1 Tax=Rosistilla ulvae TaxID=1930277 RepID=A0A517M5D3_9BACT|nr:hypothetical protein EC9_42850 [Rosistilla ulvae]
MRSCVLRHANLQSAGHWQKATVFRFIEPASALGLNYIVGWSWEP